MQSRTRLIVVEDEPLVVEDLTKNLTSLGYELSAIASCADDAYLAASATQPDLILMDINLEGPTDGIEAATKIRSELSIPVVFLTAHTDLETLHRAQFADPFGYMSKPIVRANLANAIETALQRHRRQNDLKIREAWLEAQLKSVGQGLIAANHDGIIWFINPEGERLLGVSGSEVVGRSFASAVPLRHRNNGGLAEDLARLAFLQGKTIDVGNEYIIDGPVRRKVAGEIAVSRFGGEAIGVVFTFRDETVEPYCQYSFFNHLALGDKPDCSRQEMKLDQVLREIEPDLRANLPRRTKLKISAEEGLHSIWANQTVVKSLLIELVGLAKEKFGKGESIYISASNIDFERRKADGSISRYVRLGITYKRGKASQRNHLAASNVGGELRIDLGAKVQSALQALHATAQSGISPWQTCWEIHIPAVVVVPARLHNDKPAATLVLIDPDSSVRSAICERYLADEDIECLGAHDVQDALEWVRTFRGQIDVIILPEACFTADIDRLIEEYPTTSLLLIAEQHATATKLLERCRVASGVVDRLCSHEVLADRLDCILRARRAA